MAFYYPQKRRLAPSVFCEQGVRKTRSGVLKGAVLRFSAFVLPLTLAAAAFCGTVTCNNNSGDASAIQNALNAGGTLTINGTCSLGGTTLTFGSNVTINGNATLNHTGSGFNFASSGSNNTITGLTLNGGGIHLTLNDTAHHTGQSGWTITNNTIQNATDGVFIDNIIGRGSPINNHSTISNNRFLNLSGWGIYWGSGIDNTLIDSNAFDQIALNPLKGFDSWFCGFTDPYTARNIVISNNDMQRFQRIGFENQGYVGGCPGGCNSAAHWSDGTIISGNFVHNINPLGFYFAYSLFWADNAKIINNTAINSTHSSSARLNLGFEWAGFNGSLFQGNVAKSVDDGPGFGGIGGWALPVTTGFTSIGTAVTACTSASGPYPCTVHYNNNVWVNNPLPDPTHYGNNEGGNQTYCFGGSTGNPVSCDQVTYLFTGDYKDNSPGAIAAVSESSSMSLAFSTPNNQTFPSGGNGTWTNTVISNLSIRQVRYFIDGSRTPVATQEIQDVNKNFASDRKWLYHATLNVSSLGGGNHTITAVATDVSGATQSVTQNFVVGSGGGTPKAQITPVSLAFGSQPLGQTTAGQTATLSNTGTAALAISNLTLGGANASEFSQISTCGNSLGAGASCTMTVTFTPAATGSRSATLSISDNDSGSPQTVSLSGTGTNPSGGGTPKGQVTPASLAFGSQPLGISTAAQTATLSNTGTAALAITNISLGGANASDFSQTSSCGSSLGAGASCTMTVTFTSSAMGSRTATLSISDNDSGSPQTVTLSGSGTNPSGGGGLPTNLPTGMILWLANNAGVVKNGNGVSAWDDQSGNGNGAFQPNAANQPTLIYGNGGQNALSFDGTSTFMSIPSLPINGATGLSVFLVSANSTDVAGGYANHAFLWWPETGPWGTTYFGSYQTSSQFRFGTGQAENQPSYQMIFTRTNSFGLSEWMHSGTTDSMWLNGQSVASYPGKLQSINNVGNNAFLGHSNNTFYPGDVSELIVYGRALSTSERQGIEQYLMKKYHL